MGVFITSWSVALSFWLSQGFELNMFLLALATMGYYSLDHWLDLKAITGAGLERFRLANGLLLLTATLFALILAASNGFVATVLSFAERFWLSGLIGAIYFLLRWVRSPLKVLLKPLLIALAAGAAIAKPALGLDWLQAALVCFCNVLVFAYLERNKDLELGNPNLFNSGFEKRWLTGFIVLAILFGIASDFLLEHRHGYGLTLYAFLSLMILLSEQKLKESTYRWWLDACLPLAFLPIG